MPDNLDAAARKRLERQRQAARDMALRLGLITPDEYLARVRIPDRVTIAAKAAELARWEAAWDAIDEAVEARAEADAAQVLVDRAQAELERTLNADGLSSAEHGAALGRDAVRKAGKS